jgi:hypothetical protein
MQLDFKLKKEKLKKRKRKEPFMHYLPPNHHLHHPALLEF